MTLDEIQTLAAGDESETLELKLSTGELRTGVRPHGMSRGQYNQMLLERLHGERRWENEPAPGWGVDDLERQRAILSLLAGAPTGYALREIIPRLGDSPAERQVRDDLRILRTLGLAMCEGHGRGARWKRQ